MKKVGLVFLLLGVIFLPFRFVFSYDKSSSKDYLNLHADNPWSTMALAALGESQIPTSHLKSVSSPSPLNYSANILAITGLKQDPKTFGDEDYVAKLKSYFTAGQIGDEATLNDDIFGLLALVSAGEKDSTEAVATKQFLLNNQNSDGGWGFVVGGGSDSNMTSATITALISSGVSGSAANILNALEYLKTAQNSDGGFTYDPLSQFGTNSDSSSTAWVLWALNSLSIDQSSWSVSGHTPVEYLESNQANGGYFEYQSGSGEDAFSVVTTAYAVIALEGKTLPLFSLDSGDSTFSYRIEGSNDTVCSGKTEGPTALDVVKNASSICGFSYHIQDTSFGPYLDKIGNDEAQGLLGWIYLVNNLSPSVGAADYVLNSGDEVLWFFGDFNWKPTRLTVNENETESGGSISVKAEYFDGSVWGSLSGASVFAGTETSQTNDSGSTVLSLPDGYYKVFAEKDGFVRSNSVGLTFGSDFSQSSVSLKAFVETGKVEGETIAFSVDENSIDFGSLKRGESAEDEIVVTNTGTVDINIFAKVTGNSLFVDNLKIKNTNWNLFSDTLLVGNQKTETVSITVPLNYGDPSGVKNGQIIFWANAK